MSFPLQHYKNTSDLVKKISTDKIGHWLLNEGYFPEQYVLPPSFSVSDFALQNEPYIKDLADQARRELASISYPKTTYTARIFGLMHPRNYHDIVFWMMKEWDSILNHLFHPEQRIFSYSFPIPVTRKSEGDLGSLRSGRMIYEWIAMAEKDLVAEAHKFGYLVRADIANCYSSIYTHSIAWALHGQLQALADRNYTLIGSKIDRLVQYANGGRTNGICVGPVLSDLIAEIVLSKIDLEVSRKLKTTNFLGTRFKDDYRILCETDEDAKHVLKTLSDELVTFNLSINENKTCILTLPNGLYRDHDIEFQPMSLRGLQAIPFKIFEQTLLRTLEIHKKYPGTSLLEKFLCELFTDDSYKLKIEFSRRFSIREKEIFKAISLLLLTKRESEKCLGHVFAVFQSIYEDYGKPHKLKEVFQDLLRREIEDSSKRRSNFGIVWSIFFARCLKLGISDIYSLVSESASANAFVSSMLTGKQQLFKDSLIKLFRKPRDCEGISLARLLAVFNRDKENHPSVVDEIDGFIEQAEIISISSFIEARSTEPGNEPLA